MFLSSISFPLDYRWGPDRSLSQTRPHSFPLLWSPTLTTNHVRTIATKPNQTIISQPTLTKSHQHLQPTTCTQLQTKQTQANHITSWYLNKPTKTCSQLNMTNTYNRPPANNCNQTKTNHNKPTNTYNQPQLQPKQTQANHTTSWYHTKPTKNCSQPNQPTLTTSHNCKQNKPKPHQTMEQYQTNQDLQPTKYDQHLQPYNCKLKKTKPAFEVWSIVCLGTLIRHPKVEHNKRNKKVSRRKNNGETRTIWGPGLVYIQLIWYK